MIGSLYIRMEWNGIFLNCKFKQAEMVRYCERNMGSLQIFLIKIKNWGSVAPKSCPYKKITERPPFCKQFFLMIFIRRNALKNTRQHGNPNWNSIGIIIIIIVLWSVQEVNICNDAFKCRLLRFCLSPTPKL